METKDLVLRLLVKGEKAQKDLDTLLARLGELQALLKETGKLGADAFKEIDAAIRAVTKGTESLSSVTKRLNEEFRNGREQVERYAKTLEAAPKAAEGSYNALKDRLKEVTTQLRNTAEFVDGQANPAYQRLNEEYVRLTRSLKEQDERLKASAKVNNITAGSINDMRQRLKELYSELDNTARTVNGQANPAFDRLTKEAGKLSKELKEAEAASGRFQRNVGNYPTFGERINAQFKEVGATFLAAFSVGAVVQKTGQALASIVETGKTFEASISNLSAITGAAGKDLEFLRNEALRLGSTTTSSAAEVAEAFKLLASSKPELLENAKALVEVTEATILLAEASGLQVPEAANALTTALNQFKLPASEALNAVNALAAGAKFGSAEIPELSDALKKFGPVAESAGISVQQSVAAIETLGESKFQAEIAGNALKNILIKLQKEGIGVTEKGTLDLGAALEELAPSVRDVTKLSELFGLENVAAAQALIKGRDTYLDFTEKITNAGNVAAEQARINTDNLEGDAKRLANALQGLEITIFDQFSGDLRAATQAATGFVAYLTEGFSQGLSSIIDVFKDIFSAFSGLGEAFGGFISIFAGEGTEKVNIFGLALKSLAFTFKIFTKPVEYAVKLLSLLVDGYTYVTQSVKDYIDSSPRLIAVFETIGSAISTVSDAVVGFGELMYKYSGAKLIVGLFSGTEEAMSRVDALKAVFGNLDNALEALRKKFGATTEELEAFKKGFDQTLISGKSFAESAKIVNDEFVKFLTATRDAEAKAQEERDKKNKEQEEKDAEAAKQRAEKAKAEADRLQKQSDDNLKRLRDAAKKENDLLLSKTEEGLEILRKSKEEELKGQKEFAKLSAEEQKLLLEEVNREVDEKLATLRKQRADKEKKDLEETVKASTEAVRMALDTATALIESSALDAEKALADNREKALAAAGDDAAARFQIEKKYGEDLADLKDKTADELLKLQLEKAKEQAAVQGLSDKEALDAQAQVVDLERELLQRSVAQEQEAEEKKREEIKKTEEARSKAVKSVADALTAVTELAAQDAELDASRTQEKIGRIDAEVAAQLAALQQEYDAQRAFVEAANLTDEQRKAQLDALKSTFDTKSASVRDGVEVERQALDKQLLEEQARKEKAIALAKKIDAAQALIDNARIIRDNIAILTSSLKAGAEAAASVPFPANLIALGAVVTALASSFAALRNLTRSSVPKFEQGGEVDPSGLAQGPSHAQGGIPGIVQGRPIEFEGGEFIVRKSAVTPATLPLLERINASGPPPVPVMRPPAFRPLYADGGVVPAQASPATPAGRRLAKQASKPIDVSVEFSIVEQRKATSQLDRKAGKSSL